MFRSLSPDPACLALDRCCQVRGRANRERRPVRMDAHSGGAAARPGCLESGNCDGSGQRRTGPTAVSPGKRTEG